MQFLLVAFDGTDSEAIDRRMKARPDHFEKIGVLKSRREFLLGGAILDETGKMIGSMIVYEFPALKDLEDSLKSEPYVIQRVWEKIDIKPFRLAKVD